MKISPLAQGSGVAPQEAQRDPDKVARAKAIASGQTPVDVPQGTGDLQVDRAQASMKRIKMKTQVSTNRDDVPLQAIVEPVVSEQPKIDNLDASEPAQGAEETKPLSPQFAALAKAK